MIKKEPRELPLGSFLFFNRRLMYRYQRYKLSYTCTQIKLIRDLFSGDHQQSTQTPWASALCKLVLKNERALFKQTKLYLLVAINDTETIAEFDRLQSAYPSLTLSQACAFLQRQKKGWNRYLVVSSANRVYRRWSGSSRAIRCSRWNEERFSNPVETTSVATSAPSLL